MLSYPPAVRIGGSCVRRAPSSSRSSLRRPAAYAEEGTVAHALAELTTRYFLGELDEVTYENQVKSEFEPNSYYNAEMRECAVAYAKFVTGRLAEAKKTCPDAMIILETRLDFSKYVPGGFGTGDCVIIAEPFSTCRL